MDRETLHMALALYLADNPSQQVKKMAKRYYRLERSPARKRIYKTLLLDPTPTQTVWQVYKERFSA